MSGTFSLDCDRITAIAALLLDHYGAIGLNKYPAPERIAGVVLVILGVSLVDYAKR